MEIPLLFLKGLPGIVALSPGAPTNYNGTGCITGGPLSTVTIFHPGRSPGREIRGAGSGKKEVRYARRSNGIDAKKRSG
ncbi:MAG: hypothetical protein NTV68_01435 [Methanomicrobiales archaeon]|nr:hypothetical protein [Methanomicrobiales archaeon]